MSPITGRKDAVHITTGYGLDGPGVVPRRGRDVPPPTSQGPSSTQTSSQRILGLIPGGKVTRMWSGHLLAIQRLGALVSYCSVNPSYLFPRYSYSVIPLVVSGFCEWNFFELFLNLVVIFCPAFQFPSYKDNRTVFRSGVI